MSLWGLEATFSWPLAFRQRPMSSASAANIASGTCENPVALVNHEAECHEFCGVLEDPHGLTALPKVTIPPSGPPGSALQGLLSSYPPIWTHFSDLKRATRVQCNEALL